MKNPAVSVVIPLFNYEKYIGECLDSLLAQTFQDFEVIVVDDCSTDNSVAIVESYAEKFGGRLKLYQTEKNSGGGGYVPRNIGLQLSRGEYIFFVDADDFIVETALEILHMAATQYNADVVYTSAHYQYDIDKKFYLKRDDESELAYQQGIKEAITLTANDPDKNLQRLFFAGNFRTPWTKFVRRDFLTENKIEFPDIISGGDFIWCIHVACHAKRLLRLPIALYFYRIYSNESVSRKKRLPKEQVAHWVLSFIAWKKSLDELASNTEILKNNPQYRAQALNLIFSYFLDRTLEARKQLSSFEIYETLYRKFNGDSVIPFLFSFIDARQSDLFIAQQRIVELENALKNRT